MQYTVSKVLKLKILKRGDEQKEANSFLYATCDISVMHGGKLDIDHIQSAM